MNQCPNCQTTLIKVADTKKECPKCGYSYSDSGSKGNKVVDAVNQAIMDALVEARLTEGGLAPWQQQYVIIPKRNYDTERQYTGINRWLLSYDAEISYITEDSIKKHNTIIKAGSKPRIVIAWIPPRLKKEEKALPKAKQEELLAKRRPFSVYHYVYRAKDIIELPDKQYKEDLNNKKYENIEHFLSSLKIEIEEGGNDCVYIPSSEKIIIPRIAQYNNSDEYYRDLFRGIVHWTNHPNRNDRKVKGEKGVAVEELVIEMASSYICHYFNIPINNNSVSYLDNWLQKIKDDAYLLTSAGQRAEKVLHFLNLS
jgi:antirestriction protein ArdC